MGQPRVKWGQVRRYFERRGYEITSSGGECIIRAPRTSDEKRTRPQVTIGHKWCNHAGSELLPCYLQAIRRTFGVSVSDILIG